MFTEIVTQYIKSSNYSKPVKKRKYNKMNKIYTLLVFALLFGMSSSYAQTTSIRSIEKSAEKAMENKDFYSAWQFYKMTTTQRSVKKDSTKLAKQMYNLAESARQFKAYDVAKDAYEMVLSSKTKTDYPLTEFWLARVYHSQGKYDKAISHYSSFAKEAGQTPKGETVNSKQEYASLAESAIQNCVWAKDQREFKGFKMDSLKSVNTAATEFAPLEHNSNMYYSALEYDKENFCPDPNSEVTRLYTSDYAGAGGTTSPINWAKDEKGTFVAHTTFNGNGDRMYFTLCKRINAAEFECEIYYRDKSTGLWGDAIRLPEEVNLTGSTSTQPNIGYDENLGKELLFFVSDRADSLGGANDDMNIYCSIIEADGKISAPSKIDVNTPEDDVTPFFNKANKTLYFSSKGYQGFGGYDIYQAEQKGSGFAQPLALEKPINSSYDDYYFSSDDEMETLYFATNRLGVIYEDEGLETCCDDIYKLEIVKINLEVTTHNKLLNKDGKKPDTLHICEVSIYEIETGKLVEQKLDPNGNFYTFSLDLETDYMVVSTKEGKWVGDTTYVSTKGLEESQTLTRQQYHTPEIDLIVNTFDKTTGGELTGCTFKFIDMETGELIIPPVTRLEDNQFASMLEFGKEYKVVASKEGYSDDEVIFNSRDLYVPTTLKFPLYLEPSCLKYDEYGLEIYLYFENDVPGKRTLTPSQKKVTETSIYAYDRLYRSYIRQSLIDTFIAENIKPTYGYANAEEATKAVESFFKDDVGTEGMDKLELYAQFLNEVCLDEGAVYQVDVMGTTSPRASNEYNLMLSKRRISSVAKYLKNYQYKYTENGVEKVKSLGNIIGKNILLKLDPRGEEESKGTNIPAAFGDPRSIYSLEASKQRRVKLYNFKKISKSIGALKSKMNGILSGEE